MADTKLNFRYTPNDVSSAQRTRFLHSGQLKIILLLWVGSLLFIAAPLLLPGIFPPGPLTSWALVMQISLAYVVTLGVLILITPFIDYYVNRVWRMPLVLRFNEKMLRLSVAGKPGGLRLAWNEVRRTDENSRVFLLFYGDKNKFIILPKSMFANPADEQRLRNVLARRSLAPAPAVVEREEDEDEQA